MCHGPIKVLLTVPYHLLQDLNAVAPLMKHCYQRFRGHGLIGLESVSRTLQLARANQHICVAVMNRRMRHSLGERFNIADMIISEVPIEFVFFDVIPREEGRGFLSDGTADSEQVVA